MKIINSGSRYEIYGDDLKTLDKLPAQFYSVEFHKMMGFFLDKHADIEIKESKIYGVHMSKVKKVLRAFPEFERNLGVILSGNKGIGKSLFAKELAIESVKVGYPVIIVDRYIPGIADFIESIEQEVVILFDEFDKTFGGVKKGDGMIDPQDEMLTLFDGISCGKKMFVITCNRINSLNDYLVNRPGRFHYHFRFEYPTPDEITEYLKDKIDEKYYEEIRGVIAFSRKVNLNYDCLRAIAYELNNGEPFKNAIKDLNIINMDDVRYDATIVMDDGSTDIDSKYIDLFDKNNEISLDFEVHNVYFEANFKVSACKFDMEKCINIVNGEDIKLNIDKHDLEKFKKKGKEFPKPKYITLTRKVDKKLHYTL